MRLSFKRRVIEPEWLDELPREDAECSLRDLERLNRRWGGYSSLQRLLSNRRRRTPCSVLDVGAASGDMGRQIVRLWPGTTVTSLDYVVHHLDGAPQPRVAGDAFALPFAPRSFDFAFSSLFLHHFTNEQVVRLLAAFGRVARCAVLIVDLERRLIPYHFIPVTQRVLGWDPITAHDGPISVAAGFRKAELYDLAVAAGLRNPEVRTHGFAYRVTLYGEVASGCSF